MREANERELSHLQFLDSLLGDELSARQESSISVRTKLARFPALKSLNSFEFDEQPSLDRRLINELQSLAFIERAENVVLLGPPGVGKTHIAIGLGCKRGDASTFSPLRICWTKFIFLNSTEYPGISNGI